MTLCTFDPIQRTAGIFCNPCQKKLAAELEPSEEQLTAELASVKREVRRERHRVAATSLLRR